MKKCKLTIKKLEKALRDSNGLVTYAAKSLGYTYMAVYNFINKHPQLKITINEIIESVLDSCEQTIYEKIVREKDIELIKWYLKHKGKERGYQNTDITINHNVNDFKILNLNTNIQLDDPHTREHIAALQRLLVCDPGVNSDGAES